MRPISFALMLLVAACGRSGFPDVDGGAGGGSGGGAGGGAGGGGGLTCAGLSLEACRARTDCVADFCFACSCTPEFKGCRSPVEQAFQCPALGCAQPLCCAAQAQCTAPATCAPPGTPYGCGACNIEPGDCTTDQDCGGRPVQSICQPIACSCSAQSHCVPGCSASNPCSTGETCNASGRCHATPCLDDAMCPSTFRCASGACARRTCAVDTDCRDGFCVNGECFEALGACRLPVP